MSDRVVDAVEAATGHRFVDRARLMQAVTHPSYAHEHPGEPHYQRLEFLGDAVVGLATTRMLVERYPQLPEGDLSDLRQRLVNTKALGEVGRAAGLARVVRLGRSEAHKPSVNPRILGDVVEALFGALFHEGGLEACQRLADRWIAPAAEALRADLADDVVKNAINRLQELTQARTLGVPDYDVVGKGPDHDRTFEATVSVAGETLATGTGRSKKAASKQAAHLALEILARREAEAS